MSPDVSVGIVTSLRKGWRFFSSPSHSGNHSPVHSGRIVVPRYGVKKPRRDADSSRCVVPKLRKSGVLPPLLCMLYDVLLIKHGGTLLYLIYCYYGYCIKEGEMSVTCTTHAYGENNGEPQLKGSCGMRRVNGSLIFKHNIIKNCV